MSKPKRKRKPRKKKADVTVAINSDRSGVDLKVEPLEKIVDEESTEVKQPFVDPAKIIEIETVDIPNVPEPPIIDNDNAIELLKLKDAVFDLPEPLMVPTQRQYGEEFLPAYIKVRSKLRRLAGLT